MTTAPPRPVQIRLEGQAAAPDGPVDLVAMYVMHRAFRRDLEAFALVCPGVPVGDRARWRALARRFALFATFLHKHHSGEDAHLWPLLHERGADPAVLDALEADHAYLSDSGVFTEDLIETWIDFKRSQEIDPIRLRPHPHEFELYYDC